MRYKYSQNVDNTATELKFNTETDGEYLGVEQGGVMKRLPGDVLKEGIEGVAQEVADASIDTIKGPGWNGENLTGLDNRIDNILEGQDLDPNKDVEVLDARYSPVTDTTYDNIGDRMNTMESRGLVFNESDIPIATIKFRMAGNQPQLVTEEL